jgi:hypothetical protein
MTHNLSANGKRVIFDSRARLVASDHNSVNDVYEWEEPGEGSCTAEPSSTYVPSSGGCLFLISGGDAGAEPSWFADADEEGENAFFFTSQRLVSQDKDGLVDIYDARVGGGIPSQESEPAPPCNGEAACAGQASSSPPVSSPGTSNFQGPGNPAAPKACAKGKVRKHGKCVAKPKKKHKKSKAHGKGKQKTNGGKAGK